MAERTSPGITLLGSRGSDPAITPAGAAASSIIHIVALDGGRNQERFQYSPATFKKLRVVIHTTGAWPNLPHSDNHVTLLLLLEEGGAVQLDMRTDVDDRRGQLVWKLVAYQHSSSEIKAFDYDLGAPIIVGTLYNAICTEWALHQYRFSGGDSGCHYWKYAIVLLLEGFPPCYWRSLMLTVIY
jgi:hypothetical protein